VTGSANRSNDAASPVADGTLTPLVAAAGEFCSTVPVAGKLSPGNYIALLYDGGWQERGRYAFNVQAPAVNQLPSVVPPTLSPPPANVPRSTLGRYATVNSANGVNVRPQPAAPTGLACLAGGARIELSDGPRSAAGSDWYYVHDLGWISGDFLQSGPPPVSSVNSAADAVRAFYEALDRHDMVTAWALTSDRYHGNASGGYNAWMAGYTTTRAVVVNKLTANGSSVAVDYVYTDAAGGGLTASRRFTVWSVVQQGGGFRLDTVTSNQAASVCD